MSGIPERMRGQELLKRGVKLPLLDIDKTLVMGNNKTHVGAFNFAFSQVYGLPHASINQITPDGMIDRQIISEVVKLNGYPVQAIHARLPDAIQAMRAYYRVHEGEDAFLPTPGAPELLAHLRHEGLPLGLLTGNIEEIGWKKVEGAGLRQYLDYGAFGDMADKRVDLIPIAISRASALLEQPQLLPLKHFVIVGDSPLDVACAKAGGLECIAVATGAYTKEQLAAVGADLVVESLQEQKKIFDFLKL